MRVDNKMLISTIKYENYQKALHWFVQGVFWSGIVFIKLFYLFFY